MTGLLALLARRPHYRRLWLGETVSLLGDWLSYVAVSVLALESGQGALGLALVFAAHALPSALTSPLAGVLADRVDRRRLLVGVQLGQAALMVGMVAAAAVDALVVVQLLLFARSAVAGFLYPAKSAALRRLVDDDELIDANSLDAATWSAAFAIGTALGGVIALAGPVVALSLDALTFVVAACIFARLPALPIDRGQRRVDGVGVGVGVGVGGELVDAFRITWMRPALLEATFSKAPVALAGGAAWVLLNLTADRTRLLGSAALALGLLQAVRGVGTAIGPLLARRLVARGWSAVALLRASVWLTLVAIAAFALSRSATGLLTAALVWGAGSGGYWVFSASEMQRLADDHTIGRISAIDQLFFTVGMSAAALAGGALVDALDDPTAAAWLGLGLGLSAYLSLRLTVAARQRGWAVLAPPDSELADTQLENVDLGARPRKAAHTAGLGVAEHAVAVEIDESDDLQLVLGVHVAGAGREAVQVVAEHDAQLRHVLVGPDGAALDGVPDAAGVGCAGRFGIVGAESQPDGCAMVHVMHAVDDDRALEARIGGG